MTVFVSTNIDQLLFFFLGILCLSDTEKLSTSKPTEILDANLEQRRLKNVLGPYHGNRPRIFFPLPKSDAEKLAMSKSTGVFLIQISIEEDWGSFSSGLIQEMIRVDPGLYFPLSKSDAEKLAIDWNLQRGRLRIVLGIYNGNDPSQPGIYFPRMSNKIKFWKQIITIKWPFFQFFFSTWTC